VVDVKVEDEDVPSAEALRAPRGKGDVVEEAEACEFRFGSCR
jgi:hypothetical protein